jgi:hypothetical protein
MTGSIQRMAISYDPPCSFLVVWHVKNSVAKRRSDIGHDPVQQWVVRGSVREQLGRPVMKQVGVVGQWASRRRSVR